MPSAGNARVLERPGVIVTGGVDSLLLCTAKALKVEHAVRRGLAPQDAAFIRPSLLSDKPQEALHRVTQVLGF